MDSKYGGTSVIELGSNDFNVSQQGVQVSHPKFQKNLGLVKFYAPWCPHCTDMVPTLSYLSDNLGSYGFTVAAVNCDDTKLGNDNLAQKIGVEGFPTIFFVTGNGQLEQYDGGRDLQPLLESIVNISKG